MPSTIHNFNFIVVFDKFDLMKSLRKPTSAPAFIKAFMKISPDRLKSAYFITGTAGSIFYDVAKKVAPASIMNKTVKCKSHEQAAALLESDGILKNEEIPIFMNGKHEQDESITQNYFRMIKEINIAMHKKVDSSRYSSKTFVCKGSF